MNSYLGTIAIIYLVIDIIWIFSTSKLWDNQVSRIQNSPFIPNRYWAMLSYIFIVSGLLYFGSSSPTDAFIYGIIVYGVFDLTNLALFKDYKPELAMLDIAWGGFVCWLSVYLAKLLFENK